MSDCIKIIISCALWYCVMNDVYRLLSAVPLSCRQKTEQSKKETLCAYEPFKIIKLGAIENAQAIYSVHLKTATCIYSEHMIRVGRANITQVKQAERRKTVLKEANLSVKILQHFVAEWQMYWGSDKIACFWGKGLLYLQSFNFSSFQRTDHVEVKTTNNETSFSTSICLMWLIFTACKGKMHSLAEPSLQVCTPHFISSL